MTVVIRDEAPEDAAAIADVNRAAFPTHAEARLVDALRAGAHLTLSLVAVEDTVDDACDECARAGLVVGHIAFSPVSVLCGDGRIRHGLALGPMAVVPARQRSGIGTSLAAEGVARLALAGHPFCVVVGHPRFYPRFGFVPASRFGLRWERDVSDEAFLARELVPGGLDGVSGVVRYGSEFDLV